MKNKFVVLFAAMILVMSCEKKENECNCNNPIEDIAWLRDLKSSFTDCTCEMTIFQGTYKNETVFYSAMSFFSCDGYYPIVLRNCSGDAIKTYEPPLGESFEDEVTNRKALYSCSK
jgi:hypothetical protein